MANALITAGATTEPTSFAPLYTSRFFTGLWTNSSPLQSGATTDYQERFGMGRQDCIHDGRNSEISPRLTLIRRAGSTVFNSAVVPPVKRFYSFNTFTLTDESVRVMADTAAQVLDVTDNGAAPAIFTKSAGAGSTYFLGVGNTLFMTNGVDNVQYLYPSGEVFPWGIATPTVAPNASIPAWAGYGQWAPSTVIQRTGTYGGVNLIDSNGNVQYASTYGRTGTGTPAWLPNQGDHTPDGTVSWQNRGNGQWLANHSYGFGNAVILYVTAGDGNTYFYTNLGSGLTGVTPPGWLTGLNSVTPDNGYSWINMGRVLSRDDIGDQTVVGTQQPTILDSNGNVQQCLQAGKTGTTVPIFAQIKSALTSDPAGNLQGAAIWQNIGSIAAVQYGYAYMNSQTVDISNMSPPSLAITSSDGELVDVTGPGTGAAGVDTVIVFRTAHGGSTFLYAGQIPNPGAGNQWQFEDNVLDADLNTEWQAQRVGEGTPLPAGASCLAYHLGRIAAAVGNVVYLSSGPDAVVGGSSGNAGFDTTFTCQSKVTRFWTCPLGLVVFTVRDAYIILGSATASDPLYMVIFIEDLPLRSYDCFTVNKTTPFILMGNNTLLALDPSAGITEVGYPIADLLETEFDSGASYVTFHKQSSRDTALYVANGVDHWYRMNALNAPENGSAWSPRAQFDEGLGCVQSVEVSPGTYRLLMSGTSPGPILKRDATVHNDNGALYPSWTQFGTIVLAQPGQLAALFFITLESIRVGTRPTLGLLLGELEGTYDVLNRTRQDPTNLPPSRSIYSDRYHFAQNQKTAWCRWFVMEVTWPEEDAANELLTFTIFGQNWQEMRAQ